MKRMIFRHPSSFCFTTILLIIIFSSQNYEDQSYQDCSSRLFECGDIQLGYPFWGLDRPIHCGLREFHLNCSTDRIPIIVISNLTYQVLMPTGTQLPSGIFSCSNGTGYNFLTTEELFNGYQGAVRRLLGSCRRLVRVPVNRTALASLQKDPTADDLKEVIGQGFGMRWTAKYSLCVDCRDSGGECGFRSEFTCFCSDQPYDTKCRVRLHQSGKRRQLLLKILLPSGAAFVILLVFVLCHIRIRALKKKKESKRDNGNYKSKGGAQFGSGESPNLQAFTFSDIKTATNNFSSDNLLGSGGYGPVYKGVLPGGEEIAVKRLSKSSTQGLLEFKNEVSLTARLQHVNLVRVVGFCTENEEKMLVYEFMPSRSLDLYLFDPVRRLELDWNKRVMIIEGVMQGLLYLQEYSNFTIIHRDLKASNILLDDGMNPKISDFGMAKLFRKDLYEANTNRRVGTYGYVPPEYVKNGIYSMKYDVYSFGVSLLQIISGKKTQRYYGPDENLNLLDYAYDSWRNGQGMEFWDSSLDDSCSQCKLMTCMQVGLLCVQEDPDDRPTMLQVSALLRNGGVGMGAPKRPGFSVMRRETNSKSQQEICSYNDADISQVEPR
ncbi:Cysteine-rich receptor-like protein kinase 10 [Linum grandiflorum]